MIVTPSMSCEIGCDVLLLGWDGFCILELINPIDIDTTVCCPFIEP